MIQRIAGIEDSQKEMHKEARSEISELRRMIESMTWKIVSWQGVIILLAVSIIGFLITKGVPWHQSP